MARAGAAEPPRLLLDINIILDVILDRAPWSVDAAKLLDAAFAGRCSAFVASHSITTIHYFVERQLGKAAATSAVSDVLSLSTVVPLNDSDFHRALTLGLSDFEDAVQVAAALHVGAKFLVTRNAKDFKGAPVNTRSAGEILALLKVSLPTSK